MPTLQCPSCGKTVRFEGVAGVCPNCAAVVRASKPSTGAPSGSSRSSGSSKSRTSRNAPDLGDLNSLGEGEEVFAPSEASYHQRSASPFAFLATLDKRVLFGGIGALFVISVFAMYVIFHTPKPSDDAEVKSNPAITYTVPTPKVEEVKAPKIVEEPPQPPPAAVDDPDTSNTTAAVVRPAWMGLKPVLPKQHPVPINDKMVEESIRKAVGFLKSKFQNGELVLNGSAADPSGGPDAIAVYALLHAGEAIDDSDLKISGKFLPGILDRLKQYPMTDNLSTYTRSLRASALAMHDRDADRTQFAKDLQWLFKSQVGGAYGYGMPSPGTPIEQFQFDHSNSQYGVLGVWSGLLAGQPVPDKYWADVEAHWLSTQGDDGSWGYRGKGDNASLTMTCAGVTTLCVAAEQQNLVAVGGNRKGGKLRFSDAINKSLAFLSKGDELLQFNGFEGYCIYGVERAALATGFRYFGDHDWYREIGAGQLKKQLPDGSWDGHEGPGVETSFRILFLARGRQPLLMDKLRFNGSWDNRPRDVAKLTQFASSQLERPFAWGVADLDRDWSDWLESPMLLISSDTPPSLSDDEVQKLRSYIDFGGLVFVHNENGSKDMDAFSRQLAKRLYPDFAMTPMAPDNLAYSSLFTMKTKPVMEMVSNGTRPLLIYSPKDLTQDWVRWKPKDRTQTSQVQIGLNLFIDAAGKSDFHNRLNSPYLAPSEVASIGTVPIARVSYPGPWNPEPAAYVRFARSFQNDTSITLDVQNVDIKALDPKAAPVAMLTGNASVDFSKIDTQALHDYVEQGGILIIDSCGGNKAFASDVREGLLPKAFPGLKPTGIPSNFPILAGSGIGTDPLPRPRLRSYASTLLNGVPPNVQYATLGKGAIVISDLDLTTGLLNSGTYGIYGYSPAYCQSLVKNVVCWALSRYRSAPATAPAAPAAAVPAAPVPVAH